MHTIHLDRHDDFEGWRRGAKAALLSGLQPETVEFQCASDMPGLFDEQSASVPDLPQLLARPTQPPTVPKAFLDLARHVVCHSHSERFALLYRLLVRLQSERSLLMQPADRDVHRANVWAKEIRRDAHKMKAFVRFRKTGETEDGTEQFVSWFEPTHHIVAHTAPFFMRRFAGMHWSILTPKGCAHWDGQVLSFSDPVPKSMAPQSDALEDYWKSYYAAIFNPARLKVDAMTSEMPKKYWKNLPEAALIPDLIATAEERQRAMREKAPTLPKPTMMAHKEAVVEQARVDLSAIHSLEDVNIGVKACQNCPLHVPATQAVPGVGPSDAPIMIVGEQPGDREDLAGEPFVGPAGQVLHRLIEAVGLDGRSVYLTNAVKHFKFEPRGKRRLHKNPSAREIDHCRFWLQREIALVRPQVIVALGASALRGVTGRTQKLADMRGQIVDLEPGLLGDGQSQTKLIASYHPSYILRLPEGEQKQRAEAALSEDLAQALRLCR